MEPHLARELEELKARLRAMSDLVDDQLDTAYRALFEGDPSLVGRVNEREAAVNALDTAIDTDCQRIFAIAQPVAVDLRLLMSALNVNHELERIGDIAVNIAERVGALLGERALLRSTRLEEMAEIARIMVRDALEAYLTGDPRLAVRVLETDDVVDRLDRHVFQYLVRVMQAAEAPIEPASHMMILSRHLERLADHATNIAEVTVFLVNAKVIKHGAGSPGPS
jgi:phosphate transport system protein